VLVSDDYTIVRRVGGKLLASAPPNIAGKLEVRGMGIIKFDTASDTPVCLMVDLNREVLRMPEVPERLSIAGMMVPVIAIAAQEASAPVKTELALARFGLALA
jgi:serine kinase of HPr protein (carbohydrate metabolism regulator)